SLFAIGILSSGFLAVPVLAGSAAYAIAEVFGWSGGFDKSFTKAKEFYVVIIASTIVGLSIPLLGLHPVKVLFFTSLLYAMISPILIAIVIHMANNKKIMGDYSNDKRLNWFGYITFWIMATCSILIFFLF
ncbi:MAG TPA: divalent metal cation transporter, partial [Candidatus Paceibacterota bacterium]